MFAHGAEIDGKPLIDAGFTAHPSFLSIPADVEKLRRQVSFALAEEDLQISPVQSIKVKRIVEDLPSPATGESFIIEGTGHGFAVRADITKDDAAVAAAQPEDQAIAWFGKHL